MITRESRKQNKPRIMYPCYYNLFYSLTLMNTLQRNGNYQVRICHWPVIAAMFPVSCLRHSVIYNDLCDCKC